MTDRKGASPLWLWHPQAGVPRMFKKAKGASQEEKTSKQHSSMASALVPVSKFLP